MDIEEAKKFARNKIEADTITQQVRDVIKMTKWQKQDAREGFKETFKPLIKSQDSIKKSIDEQQNATIAQLKANQLALTSGLEKINETNLRLAEMRELPALEGDYDEPSTSRPRSPTRYNIEKNFDKVDLELLEIMGYPRPNNFFGTDIDRLEEILNEVKNDVKTFTGELAGLNRKKNKTEIDKAEIDNIKMQKDVLHKYKNILKLYLDSLEYKMGEGLGQQGIYFNNPIQLLDRLELLGGSILAGNNGVIPEFSQIAHLLNQMKVITKKQLNNLLKTYIPIIIKMEERAIHISSVNREKRGTSKPGDFTIKFNPSLKLDPEKKHQLALDRLSMTYSWYNIRSDYKNNKIKYTHDGTNWQTITFTDGMYSYSDINDYIHQYMEQKNHHSTDSGGKKTYSINLTFILSTYRVLLSLEGDYQLDLRGTEFGDLIGFEKKLITKTEYGTKLPNITNSIDVINTNTIAVIPTDNLTRSFPFTFEPKRPLFCNVSSFHIDEMRIYVTDSLGRPVDFNGIDWFMTLILHSM